MICLSKWKVRILFPDTLQTENCHIYTLTLTTPYIMCGCFLHFVCLYALAFGIFTPVIVAPSVENVSLQILQKCPVITKHNIFEIQKRTSDEL